MTADKPEDKKEQLEAKRSPEAPAKEAVIGATPQQDRWKLMEQAHYLEQDESATGLFYKPGQTTESTGKFGIDGLDEREPRRNANGTPYVVYSALATQAVERSGPIDKPLTEGEYQSGIKLNVQITQVPEVSTAVNPDEALGYAGKVLDSGVAVVRQAETHLAQPNTINNDLINAAIHYSQSPYQLNRDLLATGAAAIERLDKPMTAEERAGAAGALMPMFFFDGHTKPVEPEVVQQMRLEEMSAERLKGLGITRVEMHMPEVPPELRHLELTKAEPELIEAMEKKGREIVIADPTSEDYRYLLSQSADASTGNPDLMHILLKEDPNKIAAFEEFLHGTQKKLGIFDKVGLEVSEVRVKDFMLRHARLLQLSNNDLQVLQALLKQEEAAALRRGFSPSLFKVGGYE